MSFTDWLSGNNNPSLPKSEYLYGTRHLIVLALVVVLSITLSLLLRKKSYKIKKVFFTVCACIFLAIEILQRILNLIFASNYSAENIFKILLPLYFCAIAVWLLIIALLSNKKPLINAAAIIGLLVTFCYLIYPAVGLNKMYLSFGALYSICSHAMGFIVCVLLISSGYVQFNFNKIWQTFLIFGIIVIYGLINSLFLFKGTDYIFILNNPLEFNTIIPFPIVYLIIISIYITSFYFISFIVKKLKFKNQKNKTII